MGSLKARVERLERMSRGKGQQRELAAVFLANIASLRGEGDPPPLAGSRPEWQGTFLDVMTLAGDGPNPREIPDLSEP